MTSGGLAPCLASSIAYLIEFWAKALKEGKISGLTLRMYIDGYKGLLTGDSTVIPPDTYEDCKCLHDVGGSPIGNSRVKVRSFIDVLICYLAFAIHALRFAKYVFQLIHKLSSPILKIVLHADSSKKETHHLKLLLNNCLKMASMSFTPLVEMTRTLKLPNFPNIFLKSTEERLLL